MSMFRANRLSEARAYNRITGEQLANLIGVKKQSISQFENNKAQPDYGTVCRISEALKFPVHFFYEDAPNVLVGNTYFRAPFSSNKKDLNSQKIKTQYVAHIYGALARYVDFCPYNIPEFRDSQSISSIAGQLRDYWGLGQEPIADMISLLERNGVVLSEFATETKKIDAFYQYGEIQGKAYHCIVLGTEKLSFSRRQFSVAHELGHILLHEKFNDLEDVSREDFRKREDEANEFAANFLLPREAFLADLQLYPNKLNHYVELKRKWRVSISAMVMRAHSLEVINSNQYQYLMRQISKNGWRTEEPLDNYIPLTHPKALRQAVNLILLNNVLSGRQLLEELHKDGVSLSKSVIDEVLSLPPETIILEEHTNSSKIIPFAALKKSE